PPGLNPLTAPRSGAARVALGAGAAADQRQLAALRARVALVALQPGHAHLLVLGQRQPAARPVAVLAVAVAVAAVAVARPRVQLPPPRRGERALLPRGRRPLPPRGRRAGRRGGVPRRGRRRRGTGRLVVLVVQGVAAQVVGGDVGQVVPAEVG